MALSALPLQITLPYFALLMCTLHNHKTLATQSCISTFDFKRVEELKQNVALKLNTYLEIDDPDHSSINN